MYVHGYKQRYPFYIVFLSVLHSIGVYFLGSLILYLLFPWLIIPFVFYIIFLEYRLLRYSCTSCYYFGKTCAFGKGSLSALFFRKREASEFSEKCISWKHLAPELLLTIVPLFIATYLLITSFSWIVLISMLLLFLFSSVGNSYIRGQLACAHCRQKELGCPAFDLFNKPKSRDNIQY